MNELKKTKDNDNAIDKPFSKNEAKEFIKKCAQIDCDPSLVIKKSAQQIKKYLSASQKVSAEEKEELDKTVRNALSAMSLETHFDLSETFDPNYRFLVIEVAREIEKEYNCTNYSEKALVEVIANSYVRIIDNSKRLNTELGGSNQLITENKTKYLSLLSKQLDRSNRQFISALIALKQIKAPEVKLNIKSKNTFLAQNQQFNAGDNYNQEDENIKAK
jgi:hypothetical protein